MLISFIKSMNLIHSSLRKIRRETMIKFTHNKHDNSQQFCTREPILSLKVHTTLPLSRELFPQQHRSSFFHLKMSLAKHFLSLFGSLNREWTKKMYWKQQGAVLLSALCFFRFLLLHIQNRENIHRQQM